MKKTFITLVLDETGSMSPKKDSVISGTNEYVNAHKEIDDCYASLITFDKVNGGYFHQATEQNPQRDAVRVITNAVEIKDFSPITSEQYNPHGMTNLYDAVGFTIKYIEDLTRFAEDPIIIVSINTDGEENASTEYTAKTVSDLIKQKKELGWQFIFMGEDLSVERTDAIASILNVDKSMTMSFMSTNRAETYRSLAGATAEYTMSAKSAKSAKDVDFATFIKK